MDGWTITLLLILGGVAAATLIGSRSEKPRVHMIDAVAMMRLAEARQLRPAGRQRRARWVIMGTGLVLLASIFWGFAS